MDEMFTYRDYQQKFCETPMSAADRLRTWAMFEENDNPKENEKRIKEFEKFIAKEVGGSGKQNPKIGRNDKCPCGSGKKYKVCCLNKPKAQIDMIENVHERNKCFKNYPYVGNDKLQNRVYLEDYFDSESIEIDKLLYLGLMQRPGWIWQRNEGLAENGKREYLSLAFSVFKEKIEKENIRDFQEYDEKFSIHYFCVEWIHELLDLLREHGKKELYDEVKDVVKQYHNLKHMEEIESLDKRWKKFSKLTEKCYLNMIGANKDASCWEQAFGLLKEGIQEGRKQNPDFASQLEMLDDVTDYEYDIQGWLEDCLDEIDMRGKHEVLLSMCDDLLNRFEWPDYTGSDLKFRKSTALEAMGKETEAAEYCKDWIAKEPENIVAAAAGVYAFMKTKEFAAAEELVDRFIFDKTVCTEDNDILFTAASKLYEKMGKRKEKKQIDKALGEYEEYLQQYFEDAGFDEEELDFWDEELPFN